MAKYKFIDINGMKKFLGKIKENYTSKTESAADREVVAAIKNSLTETTAKIDKTNEDIAQLKEQSNNQGNTSPGGGQSSNYVSQTTFDTLKEEVTEINTSVSKLTKTVFLDGEADPLRKLATIKELNVLDIKLDTLQGKVDDVTNDIHPEDPAEALLRYKDIATLENDISNLKTQLRGVLDDAADIRIKVNKIDGIEDGYNRLSHTVDGITSDHQTLVEKVRKIDLLDNKYTELNSTCSSIISKLSEMGDRFNTVDIKLQEIASELRSKVSNLESIAEKMQKRYNKDLNNINNEIRNFEEMADHLTGQIQMIRQHLRI